MIHYLAYGSNLHPLRLMERVPSARLVGVVVHARHRLLFHKRSGDGSGKCNLYHTGSDTDLVYGAIYELAPAEKPALDEFEGMGYADRSVQVQYEGRDFRCFTYLAQQSHIEEDLNPYHWYKELVARGARYLNLPQEYIASIEAVESFEDPDARRRREREALLQRIGRYR